MGGFDVELRRATQRYGGVLAVDDLSLGVRRRELQIELKRIQDRVGITFVYVTHDQEEAMTMSDRVAVMNHGKIEQLAPPVEIYDHPASAFVAEFIGETNFIDVAGERIALRPEQLELAPPGSGGLPGVVVVAMVVGPSVQWVVRTEDGKELLVRRQRDGSN